MLLSQPDGNSFVLDSLGSVPYLWASLPEKTCRYFRQHKALSLRWVPFVNVQLVTSLSSNLCTAATRYSTAESNRINSHSQNKVTSAHCIIIIIIIIIVVVVVIVIIYGN